MAPSLNDLLNLPNDPTPAHLAALGLLMPPPAPAPTPAPVTVGPVSAPAAATPAPTPKVMAPMHAEPTEASSFSGTLTPPTIAQPEKPALLNAPRGSLESFASRHAEAPDVSLSAPVSQGIQTIDPTSSEFYRNQIARIEDEKAHPWGSPENHPGVIGKIAHIAAKGANIAGDILAPGTTALIPGTELNRQAQENALTAKEAGAESRELAGATEATREKHEENVSEQNEQKITDAEKKLTETEWKDKSQREVELRKQGLKPDPKNPEGPPLPISYDEMSPHEQAVHDLKTAQADSAVAKGLLDRIKADPNSLQNQAIRERIKVMAKNAATAAGKLGLDQKKFVADYFGTDEEGNPLAGVQVTPEGKPVGPKIAGKTQEALKGFNKDYEKPANDVETGYQKFQDAYRDYKNGAPTGAASMVALSQHLATTFGSVKGARLNKDLIQEHKDAIGWLDRLQRYGDMVGSGQQLSADQWQDFGKLIGNTRKLAWETAVKEAHRANVPVDFLPKDLQGQVSGNPGGEKELAFKTPEGAPSAQGLPDGKVLRDANNQVVARAKGGQWQAP